MKRPVRTLLTGEENAGIAPGKKIRQKDPHIPVEEAQIVVVAANENRPSHIPLPVFPQELLFLEDALHERIERHNSGETLPYCTKDPEFFKKIDSLVLMTCESCNRMDCFQLNERFDY